MSSAEEPTQVAMGAGRTAAFFRHRIAAYKQFMVKDHSRSVSPARGDPACQGQGYAR